MVVLFDVFVVLFFKQKPAYEMRISDWSSDVCSSDLLAELREAMARRAARAAEKIRAQGLAASRLIAFAHGSRYRPNPPSASRSARLSPPTNDPRIIVGIAGKMMEAMFQPGG